MIEKNRKIRLESVSMPAQTAVLEERNYIGSFGPNEVRVIESSPALIRKSLIAPIGTKPLKELLKNKDKILIISDDNTRHTPVKEIIEILDEELNLERKHVTILIALGTHRSMTAKEIDAKFGEGIRKKFSIINHDWKDVNKLKFIGKTHQGVRVWVNKLVCEADFVIGLGSIVPHATTGYSGGAKIVVPGVSGEETTSDTHWAAGKIPLGDILGIYRNPIRAGIDAISKKAGLKFIINTVMDPGGNIAGVVSGEPVKAHKAGVKISRHIYGVGIEKKADIVVADSYPTDIDLRQAIKAVASASLVVRDKGIIILLARCPDGIAPQFPEFLDLGFADPGRISEMVARGEIKEKVIAYTLVVIGKIMKDKARVILVTKGISKSDAEKMGFLWAADFKSALDYAKKIKGVKASVLFLKEAGKILPLVTGNRRKVR